MLQRQPTNLQLKLRQSHEQLISDFNYLIQLKQQIKRQKIPQAQCSAILKQMIQKLTYPVLGIQILKDKFIQLQILQNTGFEQFQVIYERAETIYIQSIMNDLKKMQRQEKIGFPPQSQIKNILDQISYKTSGYQKSFHQSRVNDQVGDHVDLMKFFQGVRNYQNWHQNVKKQTIEHLKHKAHQIQLNLTLKKGFLISRIQAFTQRYEQNNKKAFLTKCQKISKLLKIQKISRKIQLHSARQSLIYIHIFSQQKKPSQVFESIINRYYETHLTSRINRQVLKFSKSILKYKTLFSKLQSVYKAKCSAAYSTLLERINNKKKIKNNKISIGLDLFAKWMNKKQKRMVFDLLQCKKLKFFNILGRQVNQVLFNALNNLKSEATANLYSKPELSYRLKGKILAQLKNVENRPVDLRHTFLNWYIKGHEQKFSKQIYNIWLTGSISKFTFFMRLKNLVNESQNYKIKYQLKVFLMIFNDKMKKYYDHCQKSVLQKWVQNNRRIRRVEQLFQKCLNRKMQNAKTLLDTWKVLPDVKRSKGQIVMKKIFKTIIERIQSDKVETFSSFKQDKRIGKQKKIIILRKAFNQDFIYLQKYFQIWRLKKDQIADENTRFDIQRKQTLLLLEKYHRKLYNKNIKDIISKFRVTSSTSKTRSIAFKRVIINILNRNKQHNISIVYQQFKRNHQIGQQKKYKLCQWIVQQNKKQLLLSLCEIKRKQKQIQNLERMKAVENLFEIGTNKIKQSLIIFNKSLYTYHILNKILINRTNNIHSAFKFIAALPNRINWTKRDHAIRFLDTLHHCYKRNKNTAFNKYKSSLLVGRFRMTKCMNIMNDKYFEVNRKYFNIFRKNVDRLKTAQINKAISTSFSSLQQVVIQQYRTLFIGQAQWQLKAQHLAQLNNRIKIRIGQAFKLWHQTSIAIKHFNSVKKQKKIRYIQILTKALQKNEYSESKKVIELFRKNSKIQNIQLAFLRRLCDTQAGKVIKAMMIWKGLPQPVDKQRRARATNFQSILAKIGMLNRKKTFERFKQAQYYGNQKKKVSIRQLVAQSNSGLKGYFQQWRNNNKLAIIFGKCQNVDNLIHTSHTIQQEHFKLLFFGNQANKKREKIDKLAQFFKNQQKKILIHWKQCSQQVKQFKNNKLNNLTAVFQIKKRYENQRIRQLACSKFGQFLLHTKLTKQKQKERKILEIVGNANKKYKENIGEAYEVFRFYLYKGNFKKKRAFQNWLKDKIGHISGILNNWNYLQKQKKAEQRRRQIETSFTNLQSLTKANFIHLISNRRELQIKKNALTTIFKAQQIKLKGYLILWKNRAYEIKQFKQMDKKVKESILQRINKILVIGQTHNVKNVLNKFHKAMRISQIQKKFITQLLRTKSGLVVQAMQRWKTVPQQGRDEKYKRAQKFFNKIDHQYKSRLGFLHKLFKKQSEQANIMKKQSILQLFQMTSTGIRRFYRRWEKMTKQTHTLHCVNSIIKTLDGIEQNLSNQWMLIFQDQRAYRIKISAINKLIAACQGTTANYFQKWLSITRQQRIQSQFDKEKKQRAIEMFTRAIDGSQKIKIIESIKKFKLNRTVTEISTKFFNRLLQTKAGKVIVFFKKWKEIPDAQEPIKKKKAIKFESQLNKFAMKILRATFNPFKTCNYIAEDRKKYCLNKLVRMSMGQEQKKFTLWRTIARQDKIISHSKILTKSFQNMENHLVQWLDPMFKDYQTQVEKKKNLCRKLIMNSQFVQHHAFMIWRNTHEQHNTKDAKQQSRVKDVLRNLINIHQNHQKKSTVGGFGVFRKILIADRLNQATKKQELYHKKTYKFYSILQSLSKNRVSSLIECCKNSSIQQNFVNKISSLEQFFKGSNDLYSQNLMMVFRNQRQSMIIQNALNRIFLNFKVGTEKAFNIWRQKAKIDKIQRQMSDEKKKNIVGIINNLLGNSQALHTKRAIQLFRLNYKQTKIQKDILLKILNCKAGKVPLMFMKWKALPNPERRQDKKKGTRFQMTLYRAYIQKLKNTYNTFKQQSYDAQVKKKFAIRKLIAATQSDSTKMFNKWRKVNNQSKITQKINFLDRIFTFSSSIVAQNIEIFNKSHLQEHQQKTIALQKLFFIQQISLKASWSRWVSENNQFKVNILSSTLSKYTEQSLLIRFFKESFNKIMQRGEMEQMKGYINSLWKWKLANTEANYVSKFIKAFRQSQELLNLSKILNKKQNENICLAFSKIQLSSQLVFRRKQQLVQRYLLKKARTYFGRMRRNIIDTVVSNWRGQYTRSIQVEKLCYVLAKIVRKPEFDSIELLKANENYLKKTEIFVEKISHLRTLIERVSLKNIKMYGYYKLLKKALDKRQKVRQYHLLNAFNSIFESAKLKKFSQLFVQVQKKALKRFVFSSLKDFCGAQVKRKLSILLLCEQLQKTQKSNILKAINCFRKRVYKFTAIQKIVQISNRKLQQSQKQFFSISLNDIKIISLLGKFKKGTAIKNILQKQDKKLLKQYFNLLKKKQNSWINQSIKRFATRSSIRSSVAISLWRFKTFGQN